jgi:hypothetical protein
MARPGAVTRTAEMEDRYRAATMAVPVSDFAGADRAGVDPVALRILDRADGE